MTSKVDEALRSIPDVRARVDAVDDYFREVIRRVEDVLGELRPIAIEIPYPFNGDLRKIQLRQSRDRRWFVAWESGDGRSVPLLSAPRHVRAEVFTNMVWSVYAERLAPIEALVIAVSRELSVETANRGPQVDVARRLEATLEAVAGKQKGAGL